MPKKLCSICTTNPTTEDLCKECKEEMRRLRIDYLKNMVTTRLGLKGRGNLDDV